MLARSLVARAPHAQPSTDGAAGLFGLIAVALSIVVVHRRVTNKVSFGSGGNPALEQAIRARNFT